MPTVIARRANLIVRASAANPPAARLEGNFAALFGARAGLAAEEVHRAVLRRALYPQARVLAPVLRAFNPDFFAADHDFVAGVMRITSRGEFASEADEFAHHPANRGAWRRTFRLRASVGRMRALVNQVFAAEPNSAPGPANSTPPFPDSGAPR